MSGAPAGAPGPEPSVARADGPIVGLHRLLRPDLGRQARPLALAYLLSLARVAALFAGPAFLGTILDEALPARDLRLFTRGAAGLLASLAAIAAISFARTWLLTRASEGLLLDVRSRVVATLARKPARFFGAYGPGDLVTRVSNDTEELAGILVDYGYPSLDGVTVIVVMAGLVLAREWRLGLLTVAFVPAGVLFLVLVKGPLARAAARARARLSEQSETLLDLLGGMKEIRFHQQAPAARARFDEAARGYTAAVVRSRLAGEWAYSAMDAFSRLVSCAPFLAGGYWICRGAGDLGIGTLVAFNFYLGAIAYALEVINVGVTKVAQAAPLVERLRELLDAPEEPVRPDPDSAGKTQSTRIELRDVWFSHVPGRPVLAGFSLAVEPGEKVALVGESGAGKSTVIDLVARYLAPERGSVLFGGAPVESYGLAFYLSHFAYVRQKPYLFRTSVHENVALGWVHVPRDVVEEAVRRVGMHDVVSRLPRGYDTVLGTGGTDLSEGQKQRLALARALVRDPEVLLLDEFTSALDPATEAEVLGMLLDLFARQTILCVTHSMAVASRFERRVVLERR